MLSNVWAGDWPITQPWGVTSLTVEPYWQQAQAHWHCGVDIGCPTGTPLYAARAGLVRYLGYGLLGIQVTGRTETDYYIHVDRSVVGYLSMVTQGQLVAYSGAKVPAGGYLTGPHLHFEVNTGALNTPVSSIDPIPVLQQAFSGGSGSLGGPEVLDPTDPIVVALTNGLKDIQYALLYGRGTATPDPSGFAAADFDGRLDAAVKPVLAAIAAVPGVTPPAVTVDLSSVLNAIAALKAELDVTSADVATTKRLIEKDLAP